jgi:hypothetical protein
MVKAYLYADSPEIDPSRPATMQQRLYEKKPKFTNSRDEAAYMIQSMWWRHANKRVYRYFKDLIQFRLCGNPASLLRTINPREASLFDKATGIHVRFRLGGSSFPPTLYYKVFLLNPLCDVGSFAPRDYAYASKKQAVVTKYQNNTLTTKLHESSNSVGRGSGFKKTTTATNGSSSYMGKVSSNPSSASSFHGMISGRNNPSSGGGGGNGGSLKFPQESAPSPSYSNGSRTFQRENRSNYHPSTMKNDHNHNQQQQYSELNDMRMMKSTSGSFRTSANLKYEETKTSLGQIRVGTSYFGTQMNNVGPEGTDNWYKRVENNGWRAVTGSKAQEAAGEDAPVAPKGAFLVTNGFDEKASSSNSMAFHYSRVKRKEEKEKQRKSKKREWLLHMYKEGLAKEKVKEEEENDDDDDKDGDGDGGYYKGGDESKHSGGGSSSHDLQNKDMRDTRNRNRSRPSNGYNNFYNGKNTNSNTNGAVDQNISEYVFSAHDISKEGGGGGDDDDGFDLLEDEDLLTWSKNLDYDSYVANWHTLATSGTSGHNYHVPTNKKNAHDIVPEPDWVALKKQFEG